MNNVFNIEQHCRDICNVSNSNATVFAAFNLTLNYLSQLPGLNKNSGTDDQGDKTYGIGEYEELNHPYWVYQVKDDEHMSNFPLEFYERLS